ncbi:MAG TPA: hypothetical protein VEB20_14510 [Azospirillaceae bacterium]|nr:hypothetical protein [Azospirillaceae bacterium]
MRMKATLTIDIDVADYVEAGEHERYLRRLQQDLGGRYAQVELDFRERRAKPQRREPPVLTIVPRTGRLPSYEH